MGSKQGTPDCILHGDVQQLGRGQVGRRATGGGREVCRVRSILADSPPALLLWPVRSRGWASARHVIDKEAYRAARTPGAAAVTPEGDGEGTAAWGRRRRRRRGGESGAPRPAAAATLPTQGAGSVENLTKSHAASTARVCMGRRARTAGLHANPPRADPNFAREPWRGQKRHSSPRRICKKEDQKT